MKTKTIRKWLRLHLEWQESGEPQKAYCEGKGIKYGCFSRATYRARRKERESRSPEKPRGFEALVIAKKEEPISLGSKPYCEIRFGGGGRIVIETKDSVAGLRQLMGALGQ